MATSLDRVTINASSNIPKESFSISKFKENLTSLVRPNYFFAQLTLTGGLTGLPNIGDTFKFRCEKAEFPGRSLATADDMVGGGPALKLPYDVTYNDITLSIICSSDMIERKFFEQWMDKIISPAGTNASGLLSYYEDYALGNILKVSQLNERGYEIFTYTMTDVYPTALTPMNADWSETNTYQRFGVTLAYRYYTYNFD
jgi:hypothetical protein